MLVDRGDVKTDHNIVFLKVHFLGYFHVAFGVPDMGVNVSHQGGQETSSVLGQTVRRCPYAGQDGSQGIFWFANLAFGGRKTSEADCVMF